MYVTFIPGRYSLIIYYYNLKGTICILSFVSFVPLHYYTISKGKVASGAPPKGSHEDGLETPYSASNQHQTGRMQRDFTYRQTYVTRVLDTDPLILSPKIDIVKDRKHTPSCQRNEVATLTSYYGRIS
jgi:hypothetical protein